ncbi:MAG: phosphate ABC transporter ATP-binding protein [Pseudomonadota bacterium]
MDRSATKLDASLLPLILTEVSYRAGGRILIDRITAEIGPGQRTVILGPNGAGKSVLMRLCHGLLAPTSGSIRWNAPEAPGEPRRQAMVFQRPVMLRRSAIDNIRYALKLSHVPRREREARAWQALERVGLSALADRPARVLSGGEQQRLALARAWALKPEVLFLDEPTANLDPGASREVEAIIAAIHAEGTKIVMTTHNLGQARRLADEIFFLHEGRLVERSSPEQFFQQPASPEAQVFIKGELPWQ